MFSNFEGKKTKIFEYSTILLRKSLRKY